MVAEDAVPEDECEAGDECDSDKLKCFILNIFVCI